jgi:hypothetical protein
MKIDICPVLAGDRAEEALKLYEEAFTGLNAMTIQRHLMNRDEFDAMCADERIEKWTVTSDDGYLAGLATYTNQLEAWPLISPEYFARRWPTHYAENRIWYCGFVAVPGHHKGVFVDLIEAMYRRAEEREGVISLDICRFNIEAFHLDRAIAQWLSSVSAGRMRYEAADSQNFMVYETAPGSAA